jgi:hypothetical protein
MRHPYIFRVKGGSEFKAADRLLRFGVVPMNPCFYAYTRKQGDVAVLTVKAQLHGYFVGMFPSDRWWEIRSATYPDGSRVLGSGLSADGHVRPLDWNTWRNIMDLNSYSADAPVIEPQRGLRPGMMVVLKDGLHAGKRFRLQSMGKSDKVKIVMDFLGGLRDVEIKDSNAVEIVEAA